MNRILIFGGTTEGRKLSGFLSSKNVHHIVSVATEYGSALMDTVPEKTDAEENERGCEPEILQGRLNADEMLELLRKKEIGLVVDATHPYAVEATENIRHAALKAGIPCLRLLREADFHGFYDPVENDAFPEDFGFQTDNKQKEAPGFRVLCFENASECASYLDTVSGHILLTTGSKELPVFCSRESLRRRLTVRVLPGRESFEQCERSGLQGKQITAMQGPFSALMNLALIRQCGASFLVTKDSGKTGGFPEKYQAAQKAGIVLCVIGRPKETEGYSYKEICRRVFDFLAAEGCQEVMVSRPDQAEKNRKETGKLPEVSMIGCGMGVGSDLTVIAAKALERADLVFGSPRLINNLANDKKAVPAYRPEEILPVLKEYLDTDMKSPVSSVAVLFSGDTGFYSGAGRLYEALKREKEEGTIRAELRLYPGISSMQALASRYGLSWGKAAVLSLHGRKTDESAKADLLKTIRSGQLCFLLLSGADDLRLIGSVLISCGLSDAVLYTGYNMAGADEEVRILSPEDCLHVRKKGQYSIFIQTRPVNSGKEEIGESVEEKNRGSEDKAESNVKKRILIAAPSSGSGKTMLVSALLGCLKARGYSVCSFKCGPDYIDPMFHRSVLGIPSENLDTWFSGRSGAARLFRELSDPYEISVIEGVMGLFDGLGGTEDAGSTYDLACAVDAPVILVVNARGAARSLIPLIMGFLSYDRERRIKGILLNRISGPFYEKIKPLLENEISGSGHPALLMGYFPESADLSFDHRHLGLTMPQETDGTAEKLKRAADQLSDSVDLELLLSAASKETVKCPSVCPKTSSDGPVLAVARDEAFCFYYEANLRIFQKMGVRIQTFSPLHDAALPEGISGLLLGGGYPELFARQLSENSSMRQSVYSAIKGGLPSLAECGGFMYLHERLVDEKGNAWPMAGVLKAEAEYQGHPVRFGYEEIREKIPLFLPEGVCIRGHEFHYYDSTWNGDACITVKPGSGISREAIHSGKNHFWGFPHLYYESAPAFAEYFVQCMRERQ